MNDEEIVRIVVASLDRMTEQIAELKRLIQQIDTDRHAMVYCEELD